MKKFAILTILLISYLGCSKKSDSGDQSSGVPVYAYQDRNFSFAIGSTQTGTYAITTLPSWASFDTNTGILSGLPTNTTDGFSFTVTQNQSGKNVTFGPYSVQVK